MLTTVTSLDAAWALASSVKHRADSAQFPAPGHSCAVAETMDQMNGSGSSASSARSPEDDRFELVFDRERSLAPTPFVGEQFIDR